MAALARSEVRTVVRYRDGAKLVTFDNVGLARAVEAIQGEDPPYECGVDLDAPPGRYIVRSRSAQREGRTAFWYIILDPESGLPVAAHNCPARAANPKANIQCRHMAAAWVAWKAEQDERDPWLRKVRSMSETSTALAPYEGEQQHRALQPYVPNREEVSNMLALAKVLMETKGAAIPNSLNTPAKVAAVIMAGRELGFEPMAALKNLYVVNGVTQPSAQAIAALIQKAGSDIVYHEMTPEKCTAELVRPGRPPLKVTFTIEQARKAGLVKPGPWTSYPADMLAWKAVTRLGRFGAADIINGLESSMIRLTDITDLTPHDAEFREADAAEALAQLPDGGVPLDDDDVPSGWPEDEAEAAIAEHSEVPAATDAPAAAEGPAWRAVAYRDKDKHVDAFRAFLKAVGNSGTVPPGAAELTLGQVADAMTGAA